MTVAPAATQPRIDSVTLSVINNTFVNVCREMGTAKMRMNCWPTLSEHARLA